MFVGLASIYAVKKLLAGDRLSLSKQLVKGSFWKVFGRLFIFGLFNILVQILALFVPFGIGSIVVTIVGALFFIPLYLLYEELKV